MNNENNNLNGVVLGNITNENPTLNPENTIVTPQNNNGGVVMPENNVVNNGPVANEVVEPVIEPQNTMPEAPQVVVPSAEAVNAEPVVNPMPSNEVVNPAPQPQMQTPAQNVTPSEQKAFTNVNSITPGTGVGDNNIGNNPPISLEAEKQPKKKGNKTLFVITILVLLLAIAFGTYYVLNYTDLLSKKETITITTNNLILNVGDTLSGNIDDYATIKGTSSSNCTFNISNVDTSKEGIYKFSVTCSKLTKEGNITIIDNTELEVETQTVYHVKGDTIEAKEFIKDPVDGYTYSFVEEEAVNGILNGEAGSYTVKIKVTNDSNKETTIEGKLVISKYQIKGFVSCTAKEQSVDDMVMQKTVKLAIIEDGNNGFGSLGYDIYSFKYTKKDDYKEVKDEYLTKNTVTINGITGTPEFNDDALSIKITNEVENTVLYGLYGTDNLKNFSTIKAYFTQTLDNTCTYEKVNG